QRAVRLGDGFFGAGSATTAQFAEHVRIVRKALADQQRDPATFPIAKRIYIAVDDDATRAHDRIAASLDDLYGYFGLSGLAPVAVAGTPDDCVRGVREVIDAGAELVLFSPMSGEAEQMERLAAEVIPQLG
ncbi:MAG: LLM class flavin-dependent oxidoreductase, partial [Aldersonia sp.]|nr:LLM class flavin-dependent oxidoreductase [Aldersonia sp.]